MADAPTFEIRTKSGRIAGPFTRVKLKRYAKDKRLDPRCDIRKYDPEVEQPWRPCWKTKGLFPPEVVKACEREPYPANPAPVPERAEPEADDNWAFSVENREEVASEPALSDDLWANVPSGPMPAPAKPSKASRKKEKRAMRPKRSGGIAWHSVGTWMVLVGVGLQLALAIVIGLGRGDASPEALAQIPSVMPMLIGAIIVVPIFSLLFGLFYRLGFLVVRVPSPGYGELCGSAFTIIMIGMLFNIAQSLALRASETDPTSGPAFTLATGQLIFSLIAGVGVLMMRHALDPLRAIAVYIIPVVFLVVVLVILLLALGTSVGLSTFV